MDLLCNNYGQEKYTFFFLITYFKHNNYDTTNENNQD